MKASLAGKIVVVTKARDQASNFISHLSALGASVLHIPTIEFLPPHSWAPTDRVISRLKDFDWIVFTSKNGAGFFLNRLCDLSIPIAALRSLRIAAVGESTAKWLADKRASATLVPERFNVEGLLDAFRTEKINKSRMLLIQPEGCGRLLFEGLGDLGAVVSQVAVYKNCPADLSDCEDLSRLLMEQRVDLLTFTSPSTFHSFLAAVSRELLQQWRDGGCRIAAIGPSTALAVEREEFTVDILPQKSTTEDLTTAIAHYYN